ncbi:MAG: heme biosynthesis HemY N-terminal domain-containing protein, partial [Pseudomonadota bacterium]
MTRLLFFILLIVILSAIGLILSHYNEPMRFVIGEYEVMTKVNVMIGLVLIFIFFITLVNQAIIWLIKTPHRLSQKREIIKKDKGYNLLTQGFTVLASGEAEKAFKLSKRAEHYLGSFSLVKILSVQSSQLLGNTAVTKEQYTEMLENKDTELLALKGLIKQAMQENNIDFCIYLAKKANNINKNIEWPYQILLDSYIKTNNYRDAFDLIENNSKKFKGFIDVNNTLGILCLARSLLAFNDNNINQSYELAKKS